MAWQGRRSSAPCRPSRERSRTSGYAGGLSSWGNQQLYAAEAGEDRDHCPLVGPDLDTNLRALALLTAAPQHVVGNPRGALRALNCGHDALKFFTASSKTVNYTPTQEAESSGLGHVSRRSSGVPRPWGLSPGRLARSFICKTRTRPCALYGAVSRGGERWNEHRSSSATRVLLLCKTQPRMTSGAGVASAAPPLDCGPRARVVARAWRSVGRSLILEAPPQ